MSTSSLQAFLETQDVYQSGQEQRLRFLYSHFSFRRESNPAGFQGAIAFWRNLLASLTLKGLQKGQEGLVDSDHLVLHAEDGLPERLKWKDIGKPGDLGTVLSELAQSKTVVPLDAFLSSPESVYSSSWRAWVLSTLIGKPLWWTVHRLGLSSEEQVSPEQAWKRSRGKWVVLPNVEDAARNVVAKLQDLSTLSERLFTPASFRARFASLALPDGQLTDIDCQVLLRFLERDRRVLISNREVIKVLASEEASSIDETDTGVLRLVSAVTMLQNQVDSLERRISECSEKAAACIRSSNKDGARSALRTRSALTSTLSERTAQLENLSAVRMQIDNAATDTAVLAAYESATKALKSLTPNRDRVDQITDDLHDAMADQREVQDAIEALGPASTTTVDIDEDELEAELRELQVEAAHETNTNQPSAVEEPPWRDPAPIARSENDSGATEEGGQQRLAVAAE